MSYTPAKEIYTRIERGIHLVRQGKAAWLRITGGVGKSTTYTLTKGRDPTEDDLNEARSMRQHLLSLPPNSKPTSHGNSDWKQLDPTNNSEQKSQRNKRYKSQFAMWLDKSRNDSQPSGTQG